ncbi:hypothetical protein D3C75_718140 [compost metagenome]
MNLAGHHFQFDFPLGDLQFAVLLIALNNLADQLIDAGYHIVELARQLSDLVRPVNT